MNTQLKWRLGLLSVSHLVNDFLNGILVAILPLLRSIYGLTYTQLTALVLTSSIFAYLIQPVLGYMADKRERPWLLPVSTLLLGIGLYAMSWTEHYAWLIVAVIISALGSAAYHPDANRTVYLMSPAKRGLAQSIFQIGGNTGMALAPISLWFLDRAGMQGMSWFLVIAILMGAVLFVFARGSSLQVHAQQQVAATQEIPSETNRKLVNPPTAPTSVNRAIGTLISVVACRSLTTMGITTFLPLYLIQSHALTKADVWMYSFLFLLGGALGTITGGPLGDRFSELKVIRISLFASIPLALIIPLMHGVGIMIMLFILGFILLSTFSVTVVYAQDLMKGREGMASSLVVGFTGGISGIVILGLGLYADSFGLMNVLWIVLTMPLIAALLSLMLPAQQKVAGISS